MLQTAVYQNVEKMVMWKVDTRLHISSFQKKIMFNKWIVAIWRDVGEYFKLPNIHEFAPDILSETTSNCPLRGIREIWKPWHYHQYLCRGRNPLLRGSHWWKDLSPVKQKKAAKTMKNKKIIASVDNIESGLSLITCTNIESDNSKSNCLNLEKNTVIVNNDTILDKTDEKIFILGGHFF